MPELDVEARLGTLRAAYPASDPTMVAEVVRAVLGSMRGDLTAKETALLVQVEELAQTVAAARIEIAALGVDDITVSHIPSATDELDAIVNHTASATDSILESCETLDKIGAELSGASATAMQDATTRIYEACSFQDITGQRITKVVATLKAIEFKVAQILGAFGGGDTARGVLQEPTGLLNGPQLPAAAMDQSDIDALLASFE